NQHPEHQDGIERLPAGAALLELVRCQHHRLDLGAKALPRHEMINGFERIAPRRQVLQPLIGIEKSRLTHRPSANQNLTHQIRTGREKQLFFEVPMKMEMEHCLSSCRSEIEANVEAVRRMARSNDCDRLVNCRPSP